MFNPIYRALMKFRLLGVGGALLLAAVAGCDRASSFSFTAETDESLYRSGQQFEKQGRDQEALNAFLKLIDQRGNDNAPESHLEAGLLYLTHFKDPLAAIYHFRKYIEALPNSPQAPLVRQQIEAAKREFARTLPAQPLDSSQLQRLDLLDLINKLQAENLQLRQELAATPQGAATLASTPPPAAGSVAPAADNSAVPLIITDNASSLITRAPLTAAPTPPVAGNAVRPPSRAGAAARTHTVVRGDTLSSLSLRYYGTRAKWRDIYNANRDVMKSEGDLRIGVQLKIP